MVISDDRNLYPCVVQPDLLVVMSQPAYERFVMEVKPGALVLYEESLVDPVNLPEGCKAYGIPATRFAEELGRTIMVNIVMLGFFTAVTGLLPQEAARKAVEESVPEGTQKPNLAAFDKGYEYGVKLISEAAAVKA